MMNISVTMMSKIKNVWMTLIMVMMTKVKWILHTVNMPPLLCRYFLVHPCPRAKYQPIMSLGIIFANTLFQECIDKYNPFRWNSVSVSGTPSLQSTPFCAQVDEALQRPKVKFGQKFDTEVGLASKAQNVGTSWSTAQCLICFHRSMDYPATRVRESFLVRSLIEVKG